jgi:hypothetical protein
MTGSAVPRFDTATIDCPEPAALAGSYGALLDTFRVYADPVGHLFCLCSW